MFALTKSSADKINNWGLHDMAEEAAAKKKKGFLALVAKAFIAISSAGITFAILGKVPTGGEIEGCKDAHVFGLTWINFLDGVRDQ